MLGIIDVLKIAVALIYFLVFQPTKGLGLPRIDVLIVKQISEAVDKVLGR